LRRPRLGGAYFPLRVSRTREETTRMTDKPETPPKRKPRQPSQGGEADLEQYARFVEKARELECDDDPTRFDEMVRRIARPRRTPLPEAQPERQPRGSKKPTG
jgi:hypothetical protein